MDDTFYNISKLRNLMNNKLIKWMVKWKNQMNKWTNAQFFSIRLCYELCDLFIHSIANDFFSVSTNGHYSYGLGNICPGFFFHRCNESIQRSRIIYKVTGGIPYDLGIFWGCIFRVMVSFNTNSETNFFGSIAKWTGWITFLIKC